MQQINHIQAISGILEKTISPSAKDQFLNNEVIKLSNKLPSSLQRVVINRYFQTTLLQWRARGTVPVYPIIPMLCDDGDDENWLSLFVQFVIPFLRENSIMGIPVKNLKG